MQCWGWRLWPRFPSPLHRGDTSAATMRVSPQSVPGRRSAFGPKRRTTNLERTCSRRSGRSRRARRVPRCRKNCVHREQRLTPSKAKPPIRSFRSFSMRDTTSNNERSANSRAPLANAHFLLLVALKPPKLARHCRISFLFSILRSLSQPSLRNSPVAQLAAGVADEAGEPPR